MEIKRCGCCSKVLQRANLFDTCICRPPYCSECGYCDIHSRFYVAHDMVHTNRIEVAARVDDQNQNRDR